MQNLKHLSFRHDGMLTIIPDVISVVTDRIGSQIVTYIERSDHKYYTLKNVDEIISPYTQEKKHAV